MELIKPGRLKPGDTVATVSLSSGVAGDLPHRYQAGKRQLEETFGLRVVEAPNSQCDQEFLYRNPRARVDDLLWALTESTIAGIVSNIGGSESVRLLPFLDLNVIREHPKVFMGFSDTTVQHIAFLSAGLVSFYGPSVLTHFAENGGMHPFTVEAIHRALFSPQPIGDLQPASEWTEHFLKWADPANQQVRRTFVPNPGWVWVQGREHSAVAGHLIGGCMEVLEMLKGTRWWPTPAAWDGAVLFFETSEVAPELWQVEEWLRNYALQGILDKVVGMLFARPHRYTLEKKLQLFEVLRKVLAEVGRTELPIVADMDFGHTSPMGVLPLGCRVCIDPRTCRVAVLEAGVV
jgi:muramoyltetrapeptide carboxypeptidase LdcA involved in peptidoglycan recycling